MPKRWHWLYEHKREVHYKDNGSILDNTKVWTVSELESSVLFDVPHDASSPNDKNSDAHHSNKVTSANNNFPTNEANEGAR